MALALAACGGGSSSGGGTASSNGAGAAYTAGPGPQGGAALYAGFRTGARKFVLHQRGAIAISAATFRDRFTAMEASLDAYDGLFLKLAASGDEILTSKPVAAATIAGDLEPLYALRPGRLKYNFAVVTAQRDFDVFDEPAQLLENVRRLAAVSRDAGLTGIVVDNESLGGARVNYPGDVRNTAKTLEEYQAQTQAVSRRIMQTIAGEFPDAVVVVVRGPAGADARSPASLVNIEVDSAILLGSYFAGFVEGAGPRSLVVDGGSDYGLRTGEQFAASAAWRGDGIAAEAVEGGFIPESIRGPWPNLVSVSFGVREIDGARGNLLPNQPMLWANTATGALRHASHFAWASFDIVDQTRAAAGDPWLVAGRLARTAATTLDGGFAPSAPGSGTGLMAQYYLTVDETELAQTVVDPTIDFAWSGIGPVHTILGDRTDNISVVWSGYIEAPTTGTYAIFGLTDDGMQIRIGETHVSMPSTTRRRPSTPARSTSWPASAIRSASAISRAVAGPRPTSPGSRRAASRRQSRRRGSTRTAESRCPNSRPSDGPQRG
jgi:hypothetical protein